MRKKGITLLYIIAITAIILVFFSIVISQLQNSIFITKKVENDTKAYWAAMAGLEYASSQLEISAHWPYEPDHNGGARTYGPYEITEKTIGKYLIIQGINARDRSGFYLTFHTKNGASNIAPDTGFTAPDGKTNLLYASYNGVNPQNLPPAELFVSHAGNGHRINLSGRKLSTTTNLSSDYRRTNFVYMAAEGVCLNSRVVLEKLMGVEESGGGFSGAMFADGDIRLSLKGLGSSLNIEQSNGRSPAIIATDNVYIYRSEGGSQGSVQGNENPVKMQEGTIYAGKTITIDGHQISDSDNSRDQYYVNCLIEDSNKLREKFPALTWTDITKNVSKASFPGTIPSGSYAFIQPYQVLDKDGTPYLANKYGVPLEVNTDGGSKFRLASDTSVWPDFLKKIVLLSEIPLIGGLLIGEDGRAILAEMKTESFSTPLPERNHKLYYINGDIGEYGVSNFGPETFIDPVASNRPVEVFNPANPEMQGFRNSISMASGTGEKTMFQLNINEPVKITSNGKDDLVRFRVLDLDPKNMKYFQPQDMRVKLNLNTGREFSSGFSLDRIESLPTIYSTVEFDIQALIEGQGEILGEKNIRFESGSRIDADGLTKDNIALYAQYDVNITYPKARDSAYEAINAAREAFWDLAGKPVEEFRTQLRNDTFLREKFNESAKLNNEEASDEAFYAFVDDIIENHYNEETEEIDYSTFYPPPGSPTNITGIVFAGRNFTVDTDGGKLLIKGIIIAKGGITISDCAGCEITYDPSQISLFSDYEIKPLVRDIYFNRL